MTSGTRNITNDSDKENMMDANENVQMEEEEPSSYFDTKTYDPDQDKDEKRRLRKEYRSLISETEERRQDYLRSESNGLSQNIVKANELVQKVKHTHEATLDSRLLVLTSDLGVQKARLMKLDNNMFDADDYISKLITVMGGRQVGDEESTLNWKTVGEIASHYTQRVPTVDFMLGPLSIEQKERKSGIRQTLVKDKKEMTMPKQLCEKDIERQENETTRNVKMIWEILNEKYPINFFEFVINPESFGQTVENIFYLSFLVREGKASIDDDKGQPMLSPCEPPTNDDYNSGLLKKQLVIGIDMNMWRELIEVYDIRQSAIPMRKLREKTTGKWYG